jgi:hypothetical protein
VSDGGESSAVFHEAVREGLSKEVPLKKRFEGSKGRRQQLVGGSNIKFKSIQSVFVFCCSKEAGREGRRDCGRGRQLGACKPQ